MIPIFTYAFIKQIFTKVLQPISHCAGNTEVKKCPALMELEFNQEEWANNIFKNKIYAVCHIRGAEEIKQGVGIGSAWEGGIRESWGHLNGSEFLQGSNYITHNSGVQWVFRKVTNAGVNNFLWLLTKGLLLSIYLMTLFFTLPIATDPHPLWPVCFLHWESLIYSDLASFLFETILSLQTMHHLCLLSQHYVPLPLPKSYSKWNRILFPLTPPRCHLPSPPNCKFFKERRRRGCKEVGRK